MSKKVKSKGGARAGRVAPGAAVDALQRLADELAAARAAEREVAARYQAAERELIALLVKEKLTEAAGAHARAKLDSTPVPQVRDWEQVYEYLLKSRDFALVQRRIASAHWRELLEAKVAVPGIEAFPLTTLRLSAPRKRL